MTPSRHTASRPPRAGRLPYRLLGAALLALLIRLLWATAQVAAI